MTVNTADEIERAVRAFLATEDGDPPPEADEDLFQSGRMDSLFAIQLISHIEDVFHIEVDVDELTLTQFATIAKITQFVAGKQLEAIQ
ncbi:acyl carrier protein [Streptomyces ipomoeae]|uniref:acyl carrier protein n=1 Tax=Streptomyces ipomoeae TaxID=103232 RepID=UPI0015F12447|nr:acyl carrier protein [Streptomyces ipomoeae]MDX2938776.1 acyl carrier protein [Streptomyces ipomoeae]